MTRQTLITLTILLSFCGQKKDSPTDPVIKQSVDSISWTSELNEGLTKRLNLLNEVDLRKDSSNAHEFRCYYSPSFENMKYFRLNFLDSMLTIKEYRTKSPDGSGHDTLLSTRQMKFTYEDFKTLDRLIIRSLFWSLDHVVYPYIAIDGEAYIYECRQPMPKKRVEIKKDYQIVSTNNPYNSDLENLGQFFAFKCGYKNIYRQ